MAFTSFAYLGFLAIVVALYWIVRNRIAQNILLVIASYVFYGWLTPWYCVLLASCTAVTYGCLHMLWNTPEGTPTSRLPVVFAVFFNLTLLGILKYWNFWINDVSNALAAIGLQPSADLLRIALPIGLSFYTLQAIGLVIDAYRRDVTRHSLPEVCLFLSFFPKLIAGPFEPAKQFLGQTIAPRVAALEHVQVAIPLLLSGFIKKLVVAENISIFTAHAAAMKHPSLVVIITCIIGFGMQILADFSGYTDIARGSARLLGFQLMQNFNYPYLAISPSEFWKRWHISLSHWFTQYIYIPLGGSRNGTLHMCAALMLTMLASGAWHGATLNFAVWGAYWGLLLCSYHLLGKGGQWQPKTRIGTCVSWCIMTFWIFAGWAIFWMPGWDWQAVRIVPRLQDMLAASVLAGAIAIYLVPWIVNIVGERPSRFAFLLSPMCRGIGICALLTLGASSPDDFIYFSF